MLATNDKCPYCQGNEPLVNFDDTPIQIYIGFNEDSALSVDVDSAIYNLTFEIQAIYCPICGRRLRNDYNSNKKKNAHTVRA